MHNKFKLFILFALFFAPLAFADFNLAVIDIGEIFKRSSFTSTAADDVKKKQEDLKNTFSKDRNEMEEKYKSLGAQKGVISEKVFAQKLDALNKEAIAIEEKANSKATELEKEYVNKIDKASAKLKEIIKNYSQEKKFDLVFQNQQVAYKSDKVTDITNDMLEKLDKEMPAGKK